MRITFENVPEVALLQWNTTESSTNLTSSIWLRTGTSNWVQPRFGGGPDVEVNG